MFSNAKIPKMSLFDAITQMFNSVFQSIKIGILNTIDPEIQNNQTQLEEKILKYIEFVYCKSY